MSNPRHSSRSTSNTFFSWSPSTSHYLFFLWISTAVYISFKVVCISFQDHGLGSCCFHSPWSLFSSTLKFPTQFRVLMAKTITKLGRQINVVVFFFNAMLPDIYWVPALIMCYVRQWEHSFYPQSTYILWFNLVFVGASNAWKTILPHLWFQQPELFYKIHLLGLSSYVNITWTLQNVHMIIQIWKEKCLKLLCLPFLLCNTALPSPHCPFNRGFVCFPRIFSAHINTHPSIHPSITEFNIREKYQQQIISAKRSGSKLEMFPI